MLIHVFEAPYTVFFVAVESLIIESGELFLEFFHYFQRVPEPQIRTASGKMPVFRIEAEKGVSRTGIPVPEIQFVLLNCVCLNLNEPLYKFIATKTVFGTSPASAVDFLPYRYIGIRNHRTVSHDAGSGCSGINTDF